MGGNFALADPCKGEAGDLIGSCDPALPWTSSSLALADIGTERFDDAGLQSAMDVTFSGGVAVLELLSLFTNSIGPAVESHLAVLAICDK